MIRTGRGQLEFRTAADGDAAVQTYVQPSFRLTCGETVAAARLGYCVYGTAPTNPVVVLHPALTGSPRALISGKTSQGAGWWSHCIGPGKLLDTRQLTVVCVDHFGGNGDSTGADELGPLRAQVRLEDTIVLTIAFLHHVGIDRLHAVVGGSIGGGQCFRWIFQDQIEVERIVDISGCSYPDERSSEFFAIQRDLLWARDSNDSIAARIRANCVDLLGKTAAFDTVVDHIEDALQRTTREPAELASLGTARLIGFLRFVTPLFFQSIVNREFEFARDTDRARRMLHSWLEHQSDLFKLRFKKDALAALCGMILVSEPASPLDVARELERKDQRLIGFSVSGDVLYNSERQFECYKQIRSSLSAANQHRVEIEFTYDEANGHDHFLQRDFLTSVPKLAKHLYAREKPEGFATRAIHHGQSMEDPTGSVILPLYLTSTFERGNAGGFDYTRSGNPNFRNLESVIASLENAAYATVFGSGVSAITAVVSSLKSGDLVLAEEVIYGCTFRMFDKVFAKFGVQVEYLDMNLESSRKQILEKRPALVWVESPTNPTLKLVDIRALAQYTSRAGSTLVVDNTFASSFHQQPLDLGADLSLSSTTKYLNGHSDCLGGVVCTNSVAWSDKMVFAQKALGLNPSPFDSWLIARGLKTLSLRMERHTSNALAFAQFLQGLPSVRTVHYPMLPSHPQHALARQQMSGGSGIVTADLALGADETHLFMASLQRFTLAESLGGIESLVCHPATMSHAALPKLERDRLGITETLVRFSVGVEHIDDLIGDVLRALRLVGKEG